MRGLSLLLVLVGCASNPAPRGALPTPEQLETTARGGYILVKLRNGAETRGELLAAQGDQVWVATSGGVRAIPVPQIDTMRMALYQTGELSMSGWGAAGTISTISHGFWLVFSVPIWVITTGISAGVESRRALMDYPDEPLAKFAPWARYPQGMPAAPSWTAPPPVPKPSQ
jgi:hypothetical protein